MPRVWAHDHTLWRDDPTEIADRLGWLSVVADMGARLEDTTARCAALAAGVDHVLLAGMGGSSLFPEVVARSAETDPAAPTLHVLDTTDPAAVARLGRDLPPERTLHVAASKSGSTLETRSHLAWAWERHPDPARFAVITDPGSDLAALAGERGFAATFENPPDIGGRYSALSYFGLVPGVAGRGRRRRPGRFGGRHVRPPAGDRLGQPRRPAWPRRWPPACGPAATS